MTMGNYEELNNHVGHSLECVNYANQNVSVECTDCNEVLFDYFKKTETGSGINEG